MGFSPHHWNRLKEAVADALEAPSEERESILSSALGDEPTLLAEARTLIRSHESTDAVLHHAADAWLGLGGADLLGLGGRSIGPYRLERLISEGTAGAVYLATQSNPPRPVALKLLRINLPMVDATRRFLREAAALGRVRHPNVARIVEAGVHRDADGRAALPFIAMEFVDGPPITQYARERGLDRPARLRLMIKVASAVHAAHQQAIIHRDLKPANVLVDRDGEPKVLDFGLARLLDDAEPAAARTTVGVLLGTPQYMSPEQAAGRVDEIDVRSDVWALGVLLYELLTGRLPLETAGRSISEVLRAIEQSEPASMARHDRSLRGDLDVVVLTALAREKQRRYASAQALAEDLQRVLDHEPIAARAPSTWYLARKFARRHRVGLGTSLAFAALLGAGGLLLSVAFVRASRERDKASAVNLFLQEIVASVDPSTGDRTLGMVEALRSAEGRVGAALAGRPRVEAEVRSSLGWMYFGLGEHDRAHAQLSLALDLRSRAGESRSAAALQDGARLATTLRWQYRPEDAKQLAEATLVEATRRLDADHETTLALRDVIAGCWTDLQRLDEAEAAYRALAADCERALGAAHAQTLLTQANLAGVLGATGRYAEAEQITRGVVAGFAEAGLGGTLNAINQRAQLAYLAAEQGRLAEAIGAYRDVAAEASAALGASHEATLGALRNMANLLDRAGDVEGSAAAYADLLDRQIAVAGWDVPTLDLIVGYAAMLVRAGRGGEAQALLEQALSHAGRRLAADDPLRLRLRLGLAAALSAAGRHAEAKQRFREALEPLTAALGADHADSLVAANNYGLCLIESGEGEAAAQVLRTALERALGAGLQPLEAPLRRNLGRALLLAGRLDEAEAELLASHSLSASRGERSNEQRAAAALVELHRAKGDAAEAERWRRLATTRPAR